MHEALSFTLLHDILIRGAPEESRLWKVMEDFGRKKAKFLPCWANGDFVKTGAEPVKASLYSRGREGTMVMVSNLGKEKQQATVSLNLKRLGLPGRTQATDALSGEKLPLAEGSLAFELEPMHWRLVWLK